MIFCGAIKADCGQCSKLSHAQREAKGCFGPCKIPLYHVDDEPIYECPVKLLLPEVKEFLSVYSLCKLLNQLPMAGGILDQTEHFIEAVAEVEQTSTKALEAKEMRK